MSEMAPVVNISPIHETHRRTSVDALRNTKGFAEVLENQQRGMEVRLSAHAQERLNQQNITISPQDISRINEAARKAEMKGSRESLILLRDLALVVNIRNRTVITAINSARQKDKIFTNIDSTVIL
jgi:flagellar operon protein